MQFFPDQSSPESPPSLNYLGLIGAPAEGAILVIGKVIPAARSLFPPVLNPEEMTMEEFSKRLKRQSKAKTKEDGTKLVKVSDAITCVEDYFNNGGQLRELGMAIVNVLTKGVDAENIADIALKKIAECIRKKALQQKRERVRVRVTAAAMNPPGRPKKGTPKIQGHVARQRAGAGSKA